MRINKCCVILILFLSTIFLIPIIEEKPKMEQYRFKDIGITSTKAPFNTHLIWVHATYGIIMVDSTDQTVLLHSTIARLLIDPSDWSIVDISDNANSYKIQAGSLDENDLWLVSCDNDGTADDFEVFFIEFDDSNDCNPIDVSTGADVNSVYAWDIIKVGASFFVINAEEHAADAPNVARIMSWNVTNNPFVIDTEEALATGANSNDYEFSYSVVIGTDVYLMIAFSPSTIAGVIIWDSAINDFAPGAQFAGNADLPDDRNSWSLAYDGINFISCVFKDLDDGNKNKLGVYSITGDSWEELGVYNIALQLDRNNAGTVPNELEKGFGLSDEMVYELKPNKGGIIQLQDLSSQLSGNIVAITDTLLFAINSGGGWDIYEFQDVSNEIDEIEYDYGILGIPQEGFFIVHPDFQTNWNKEDSIKIYDQFDILEFWGLIKDKNRDDRGFYVFDIDAFSNEVYRAQYDNDYSADDLDTKQKDIIDNACDFCYRSSSIVGTTTTFDYKYKRAIAYLFYLGRFLERQIPFIEPDGKIWTEGYNGQSKQPQFYGATHQFNQPDGTSGTDIDFVDTDATAGTATNQIIAAFDGHKKVLELADNDGGASAWVYNAFSSAQITGEVEFWIQIDSLAGAGRLVRLYSGGVQVVQVRFNNANLDFIGDAGVMVISADTWYHMRIVFDCVADTADLYVDGDLKSEDTAFNNNVASINRFAIITGGGAIVIMYLDAVGYSWDPAYTVGDNSVGWELSNHWQNHRLIDIPNIQDGYFDGNTGITRATVRYQDNNISTKPIAATRDPIEQLKGVLPLKEFDDPKLEASTEADQLATNLYDIFSLDTILLALYVEDQGFMQPGRTLEIQNTGQITIAKNDYVILQYTRDPKNDRYFNMILSNNIVFTDEFKSYNDTSPKQLLTAIVQSFENQASRHDGHTLQLDGINSDGGAFGFATSGALALKVSGDNDDYLEFYTSGNIPRIKIIGGNALHIESDGGEPNIQLINDDGNLILKWDESSQTAKIQSSNAIDLKPSGDTDDHIKFSTAAGVPKIEFVGGNGLITDVADPTNAQDVVTKAYLEKRFTPERGIAVSLTNKTGVASVKGTIVEAHAGTDNAFRVCDASSIESFGVVYEDGIADGSECLVVIGGRCQVLLKDATLSTRNNWVGVSDVAGRADATGASPAAAPQHFKEIGHCIESKAADTDVLAFIILHFL